MALVSLLVLFLLSSPLHSSFAPPCAARAGRGLGQTSPSVVQRGGERPGGYWQKGGRTQPRPSCHVEGTRLLQRVIISSPAPPPAKAPRASGGGAPHEVCSLGLWGVGGRGENLVWGAQQEMGAGTRAAHRAVDRSHPRWRGGTRIADLAANLARDHPFPARPARASTATPLCDAHVARGRASRSASGGRR